MNVRDPTPASSDQPAPGANHRFRWLCALLLLLYCATRWIAVPANVTEIDEVLFCHAVDRFDISRHHPHPPGYPVYVALGRVAARLIQPNLAALEWVGLLASCTAIWPFWSLTTRLAGCDRVTRLIAAALFACSPVVWLNSARALSDVPAVAVSLWVIWLAWGAYAGDERRSVRRRLVGAAFLAAVGIGIRPQLAVVFVPLLVLVAARRAMGWRLRFWAALAAGGVCAAWLWPMVLAGGGWDQFVRDFTKQSKWYWTYDTVFGPADTHWSDRFGYWFGPWGAPGTSIPLIVLAFLGFVRLVRRQRRAALFIVAWFAPYYLFVLIGHSPVTPRYALPLLAPVALCVAASLATAPRIGNWVGVALTIGLAAQAAPIVWRFHTAEIPPLQAVAWLRTHADPQRDLIVIDNQFHVLLPDSLEGLNWLAADYYRSPPSAAGARVWFLTEHPLAGRKASFGAAWTGRRFKVFTRHRFQSAYVYQD